MHDRVHQTPVQDLIQRLIDTRNALLQRIMGAVAIDEWCAALNRGRHLYSAGRPSRWALAHISS